VLNTELRQNKGYLVINSSSLRFILMFSAKYFVIVACLV